MATRTPSNLSTRHGRPASIRSSSSKQWTPEQYTSSITAYAKQRSTTLYPGVHFTRLANLLQNPLPGYVPPSDFATLYKLTPGGGVQYYQPKDIEELAQYAETEANNVLFLWGQPCPKWLVYAGASFHIDPEFFYRHVDFLSNMSRKRYFAQPSLISTARNIFQLSYMTIGEFPSQLDDISQSELDALRDGADKDMMEYFNGLGKSISKSGRVAESIVRAYHTLDKHHFAIEQQVTICLAQKEKVWTAVVWLDTGRPLTQTQPGPWAKTLQKIRATGQETFLPWMEGHPFSALHAASMSITHERRPTKEMEQSASLIHLDYGKMLNKPAMAQDPFYALHEVFVHCAYSEVQFLNVVESKISDDTSRELIPDSNVSPANMIYFQGILDRHAERLRRALMAIESREESAWPRPAEAVLKQKSNMFANVLLQDYKGLLGRTETLSNLCKSRLQILMSRAGIVESNKAIEQAKEVTKLTRLAFVFVPLSFVSSFFGMNLGPFVDQPAFGLWVFFGVSVPLVLLLLLSLTWSLSQIAAVFLKIFKRKTKKEKKDMDFEETE